MSAKSVWPCSHAAAHCGVADSAAFAVSASTCAPGAQVYFKQADDLLRRLVTTRSRIADTEASIEVLLDQRRNGLVA